MRFTLAGNPNCGKTTLFNALTGSTAHVGNWAGVTVEQTSGFYRKLPEPIEIVDLPGIYSLSPYTPEEVVSREFIVQVHSDVIIDIIDASNVQRNLYLTLQILETDTPVVLALNMIDVAEKEGISIDTDKISALLGIPVVEICASKGVGIDEMMSVCRDAALQKRKGVCRLGDKEFCSAVNSVAELMRKDSVKDAVFHAVKLIEGDKIESEAQKKYSAAAQKIKNALTVSPELGGDFEAAVADMRYKYITSEIGGAIVCSRKYSAPTLSDKIDKFATNKYLGIPIFMLIMFLIFHFTFSKNFFGLGIPSPGAAMQNGMRMLSESAKSGVMSVLARAGASEWARGLVCDGIIGGVGAVLGFLPQILLLFFFLSVLEDTGYMARGAFIMDRILRRFGLSGKAFMPLLMGFGCSVPAIMGARTLESKEERRMTVFLIPFFSCGAKMPIWASFSAAIFPADADLVVFGIYFSGIIVAIITAILLKHTVLKAEPTPFALEMPQYHLPQPKSLAIHVWDKMKDFLVRAATVILGATIVIWVLSNFTFSFKMTASASPQSMLGKIASFVVPVFKPLGFASGKYAWCAVTALLTGLIAREMVVSSLGVMLGGASLAASLSLAFSPAAALSFMVFNLLSVPCMASVATAKAELHSTKWFAGAICFWFCTAWLFSFLTYQLASLLL